MGRLSRFLDTEALTVSDADITTDCGSGSESDAYDVDVDDRDASTLSTAATTTDRSDTSTDHVPAGEGVGSTGAHRGVPLCQFGVLQADATNCQLYLHRCDKLGNAILVFAHNQMFCAPTILEAYSASNTCMCI
jgi:hypothetical protein